jgi:hypothetical protein
MATKPCGQLYWIAVPLDMKTLLGSLPSSAAGKAATTPISFTMSSTPPIDDIALLLVFFSCIAVVVVDFSPDAVILLSAGGGAASLRGP